MEQQGPWMSNYIETKPAFHEPVACLEGRREKKLPFHGAPQQLRVGRGALSVRRSRPRRRDTMDAFDCLMIPRGAKHKKEAFEFMAYVNRQDVMEKLTAMHCKNSPLAQGERIVPREPSEPVHRCFPETRRKPERPCRAADTDLAGGCRRNEPGRAARCTCSSLSPRMRSSRSSDSASAGQARQLQRRSARAKRRIAMTVAEQRQVGKGLMFLSPWIVGFLVFLLVPVCLSFYYSFCDYSLLQKPAFIGLANYRNLMARFCVLAVAPQHDGLRVDRAARGARDVARARAAV